MKKDRRGLADKDNPILSFACVPVWLVQGDKALS